MNAEIKQCSMCAETIPLEAAICPFCDAKYEITVQGYCTQDHQVVTPNLEGLCPLCGGPLIDRRVESRFLGEPIPPGVETPSLTPSAPAPPAEAAAVPPSAEIPSPVPSEVTAPQTAAIAQEPPSQVKVPTDTFFKRLERRLSPPIVAALLNLTGLGFGFIYLRRWRRWVGVMFVDLLLVVLGLGFNASSSPQIWGPIFGGWALLSALCGFLGARRMPNFERSRLEGRVPILFYLSLILLVLEAVGFLMFRQAGSRTFNQGMLAYQEGDCTSAVTFFSKADGVYRLTFNPDLAVSEELYKECTLYNEAASAMEAGNYADAIEGFEHYTERFSQGRLVAEAQENSASILAAWATQLREQGDYEGALEKCDNLAEQFPGTEAGSHADSLVSEIYTTWGAELKDGGDYGGAIGKYETLLSQFPGALIGEQATELASQTYADWAHTLMTTGSYGEALEKYTTILEEYPRTIAARGFEDLLGQMIETGAQSAAAGEYCVALDILDALMQGGYLPEEGLGIDVAEALLNCGQERFALEEYKQAVATFKRLLAEFPESPLLPQAEAGLVDARVADLKRSDTSELAPPQETGYTSAGTSVVVISNDSPERLEVLLSGPGSTSLIIETCETCQTYSLIGPLYCPETGPRANLNLEPGSYEVIVRAIDDSSISPWYGTWDLEDGRRYFNCFIIVTRFQ